MQYKTVMEKQLYLLVQDSKYVAKAYLYFYGIQVF